MSKKFEVDKALASAKGSMYVEGLNVSDEEQELVRKRLNGEISQSEYVKKVLERINGQ